MRSRILPAVLLASAAACAGGDARTETSSASPALSPDTVEAWVQRADLARIRGDSSAPVWLVIVSDFQCPYCRTWHEESGHQVVQQYVESGKVRTAYVHFPLTSIHPNALPAAEVSMCAAAQGSFWAFHDSLFAAQEEWAPMRDPTPVFDRIAGTMGLDLSAYRLCLEHDVMRPLIAADQQRFRNAGIRSTPSFVIGNRMLEGALPFRNLAAVLDSAIAAARQPTR